MRLEQESGSFAEMVGFRMVPAGVILARALAGALLVLRAPGRPE